MPKVISIVRPFTRHYISMIIFEIFIGFKS